MVFSCSWPSYVSFPNDIYLIQRQRVIARVHFLYVYVISIKLAYNLWGFPENNFRFTLRQVKFANFAQACFLQLHENGPKIKLRSKTHNLIGHDHCHDGHWTSYIIEQQTLDTVYYQISDIGHRLLSNNGYWTVDTVHYQISDT